MHFFSNRKLVIATKHHKEQVIAPLLEAALGVRCFVAEGLDTDSLGTFTGEIARELDPVATARRKCLMAMELTGCDLGVASEGSFGPHPAMFFVSADDELLVLIDKKNNFEFVVRELSLETNFNGQEIKTEEALLEFARLVQFPSHGLILRKAKDKTGTIIKGITDLKQLTEAFHGLLNASPAVYVETDMRALYNPSRMKVIEAATHQLIGRISSTCPQCSKPGFGITDARRGLACRLCGLPTNSIASYIYICQHCQHMTEELYPHKKTVEDPMYCNYCNP